LYIQKLSPVVVVVVVVVVVAAAVVVVIVVVVAAAAAQYKRIMRLKRVITYRNMAHLLFGVVEKRSCNVLQLASPRLSVLLTPFTHTSTF
jgi:hypothetical protein